MSTFIHTGVEGAGASYEVIEVANGFEFFEVDGTDEERCVIGRTYSASDLEAAHQLIGEIAGGEW